MDVYNLHTMKREESVSSPLSIALGNFDGVHLGHAELIKNCVAYARQKGIASAVWTFTDYGDKLPNKPGIKLITAPGEKLRLIETLGVDYVIFEDFEKVRDMSPESFVKKVLIESCGAVCAVCGYNFRFGAGGKGTCDDLCRYMKPYESIITPPVKFGDVVVSSTAVRKAIESGDTESAARLLGRRFAFEATVIDGKHLGRTIGIPTINQNFPEWQIIPKSGIYACVVRIGEQSYLGVANVGVRPTIKDDSHQINCETHIIDYNGWLYGETVKLEFIKRLRDEIEFESIDALKRQIENDIAAAVKLYSCCIEK